MKTMIENSETSGRNGADESDSGGVDEENGETESDEPIANKESKDLFRLRAIAGVVLVCAAIGVAATLCTYIVGNEESKFTQQFENDSFKVFEAIGSSMDRTLGAFDSLAVSLVSTARLSDQVWPFVTIPNFAVRLSKVLPLSNAINMYVVPVVEPSLRKQWEAYSVQNDGWVDESVAVQDAWNAYHGPVIYNGTKPKVVHGDFDVIPENVSRVMLPTWQNYPVVPNSTYTYNWDVLSMAKPQAFENCLNKHQAVISTPYMIPPPEDKVQVEETKLWAAFYRYFIRPDEEEMEPMSDFAYPIIEDSDRQVSIAGADDYIPGQHRVVGIVFAILYWRAIIRDILPRGSDGIHIVFENPCTDAFTYLLKGPKVEYCGVGDKHDRKYDEWGVSKSIHELRALAISETTYSGATLDQDFCPITVSMYPSRAMQARFASPDPAIFTVVVVLIFSFVSLVFYLYDKGVERRQRTVMKKAVQSTAIVSSLFPSTVRGRLFPQTSTSNLELQGDAGLLDSVGASIENGELSTKGAFIGDPIAELYPETTVLFADIAGFTSWSSTRQPIHVFTLLETLYAGFDAIAKHHGVFKVETIGDCYVAVVGLPTPRKSHAVVMARFASDCRNRMGELTSVLKKSLGPETADLALRIGLNSGPTTAGVLRGEKSRFQLFGDTVNTAARMESNGEANRIHVSEKTAELIKLAGKEHWLTRRTEKLDYKGKGVLTSFWCEPRTETIVPSGGSVAAPEIPQASEQAPVISTQPKKATHTPHEFRFL